MGLAIFTQPIGEGFHPPLLGLGDLASHLLDDALELCCKFFDLLRAGVLARQENVFVERHAVPFPCSRPHPARSPSSPFGKGSKAQKAGTQDAGPRGPCRWAAVRSAPGQGRAETGFISGRGQKARCCWVRQVLLGAKSTHVLDRAQTALFRAQVVVRGAGMVAAFVFPGQGSQSVGMGKALADRFATARAVFEEVDAALGEKLTSVMW